MLAPSNFRRDQSRSVAEGVPERLARISCAAGRTGTATGCACWPPASNLTSIRISLSANPSQLHRGKIVFRNELIELIQYYPTTGKVHPEPILIVPAWIMKYYILDLSPENSLVKFLTGEGFTVFMISWRNPGAADRDIASTIPHARCRSRARDHRGHSAGPSSSRARLLPGGTLLSIAAAAMARDGDDRLKSITLLAAQTDFTEAGELTLFINESQVAFLEDMMWERGVLDTTQMAGAFQLLRSNDLIWSRITRD